MMCSGWPRSNRPGCAHGSAAHPLVTSRQLNVSDSVGRSEEIPLRSINGTIPVVNTTLSCAEHFNNLSLRRTLQAKHNPSSYGHKNYQFLSLFLIQIWVLKWAALPPKDLLVLCARRAFRKFGLPFWFFQLFSYAKTHSWCVILTVKMCLFALRIPHNPSLYYKLNDGTFTPTLAKVGRSSLW